jgi:hypothetical protein
MVEIINLSDGLVQSVSVREEKECYQLEIFLEKEILPRSASVGQVWVNAYWTGGRYRHYHVATSIEGNPVEVGGGRVWNFTIPRGPATGAFTANGDGILCAPGIKVNLEFSEDLWVVLCSKVKFRLKPAASMANIFHGDNMAYLNVEEAEGGLKWRLAVSRLKQARGARVEMVRDMGGRYVFREQLGKLTDAGTLEGFWSPTGFSTPTIFLCRQDVDPRVLKNKASFLSTKNFWIFGDPIPSKKWLDNLSKVKTSLAAWGRYQLVLIIDRPLRRDIKETIELFPEV